MTAEPATSFDQFAIVELYGYAKIAGRVTEQNISGHGFIRIDVPEVNGKPSFTKLVGPQSIYSITPVSEDIAMRAIESLSISPVTIYIGQPRQLQAPDDETENED